MALQKGTIEEALAWLAMNGKGRYKIIQAALNDLTERADRLLAENHSDLLDQMQEAWGNARELTREEVFAFVSSRATHRPTTTLREQIKQAIGAAFADYPNPPEDYSGEQALAFAAGCEAMQREICKGHPAEGL